MRVLVTAASKHGATQEIADAIARELAGRAIETAVQPVESASPEGFDAVVLGSAVYAGRWLEPARSYLEAHAAVLAGRATWSFSSGVWRQGSVPMLDAESSRWMYVSDGPREHRWFAGRLEHRLLSAAEREVVPGSGARAGDHRDWRAVREWAGEIAESLETAGVRSRRHEVA